MVEFRSLARALVGDAEGALHDLLYVMVGHGRVVGRGWLVRQWWGRSLDDLLDACTKREDRTSVRSNAS